MSSIDKEVQRLLVIYEDNHLIAINKRPSDIVQGDRTGDVPLSEIVKAYLKEKYNKPGNVFLGVIHRLDRPVSGVVVFAKTSKALSRMNHLFQQRKADKRYWAIIAEIPKPESGTLVHFLRKVEAKNRSYASSKERSDSKRAELSYQLISSSDRYHLLEINPLTGRHHQIRVQLSAIGCPIKGDVKYGFNRPNKDASIHLHSRSLSFEHPVSKEQVEIVAPPPEDNLWDFFVHQD